MLVFANLVNDAYGGHAGAHVSTVLRAFLRRLPVLRHVDFISHYTRFQSASLHWHHLIGNIRNQFHVAAALGGFNVRARLLERTLSLKGATAQLAPQVGFQAGTHTGPWHDLPRRQDSTRLKLRSHVVVQREVILIK